MKTIYRSIFGVIVVGLVWLGYYYIKTEQTRKKREDLVWEARRELNHLSFDKSIMYLRLNEVDYEDDVLKLKYETLISAEEIARKTQDSLMYKDFMSVIVLNLPRWQSISRYLNEADVDLSITYLNAIDKPFCITCEQLSKMVSDQELYHEGLELFTERKKKEVLQYAFAHFKKDRYLTVDSLSLDKDFISLHLSYDNTKAILGSSFLDTTHVAAHYTDKVGDMGSILDGMLNICRRTNRGFAFVYTGNKSKKSQRCEWGATKVKEMPKTPMYWNDEHKTNQVHTVIYRKIKK